MILKVTDNQYSRLSQRQLGFWLPPVSYEERHRA